MSRSPANPSSTREVQPWLARAWQAGLDFLFPPACVGCRRLGRALCATCAQTVLPAPATVCDRCGRIYAQRIELCAACRDGALNAVQLVRGAALYRVPLREAIHALKYEGRRELAVPLARYLITVFAHPPWIDLHSAGGNSAIDGVVPVPLHAERLAQRGYNQSALLAHAFAAREGLPCHEDWLVRVRPTRPQVGLSAADRRDNVAHAFVAPPSVAGKTLLVIDDVFTTGATLQACADAARRAGARAVYGLTLAAANGS